MKTSTVKSIFFVALIAKDNAAGQAIIGPTDCLIGLASLAMDIFDFDRYPEIFRADSFITLAQTGTYTGPESIEEYVRFTSTSSPYVAELEVGPFEVTLKGIDEDVCIFSRVSLVTYTFDSMLSESLSESLTVAAAAKFHYNVVENYIEKICLL